jgi:hypothetical protein
VSVFAALFALPASVDAYLYWDDFRAGGIARANLVGVDTNFIPFETVAGVGLAVSGQYIYIDGIDGVIERANVNGTGLDPNFIDIEPTDVGPGYGYGKIGASLAIGDGYIDWPDEGADIGRASIEGDGEVEPRFIQTEPGVSEVAVEADHIYWLTRAGYVGRANLDGADVEPNLLRVEEFDPSGIAVADGHIYWPVSHGIARASLEGHHIEPHFITGLIRGVVSNLAVGGRYLYWESTEVRPSGTRSWIGRANIDGRGVEQHLINVTNEITGRIVADPLGLGARPTRHTESHHDDWRRPYEPRVASRP